MGTWTLWVMSLCPSDSDESTASILEGSGWGCLPRSGPNEQRYVSAGVGVSSETRALAPEALERGLWPYACHILPDLEISWTEFKRKHLKDCGAPDSGMSVILNPTKSMHSTFQDAGSKNRLRISNYAPIRLPYPYPSIYLSINPSIHPSIHPSIYLSIYLSICLSIYLCLSVCLSTYQFIFYPSISLSVCLSIHPSIHIHTCRYTHTHTRARTQSSRTTELQHTDSSHSNYEDAGERGHAGATRIKDRMNNKLRPSTSTCCDNTKKLHGT